MPRNDSQPPIDLTATLDALPEALLVVERDGAIAWTNTAARRLLEPGTEPLPPERWPDRYGLFDNEHGDVLPADRFPLASVLAGRTDDDEREVFLRNAAAPDGTWMTITARPLPENRALLVFGDASHMHALNHELAHLNTVLARRTTELAENELRFRRMADAAPVLVWMTDVEGRCTYVNRSWLDFTGRTFDQELGEGWIQTLHPDDLLGYQDGFRRAFAARETFRLEYRRRRRDGSDRWMINSGAPRFGPRDEFVGFIGTCLDITDRKEAEAELAQHRRQLEQLVAERTRELHGTVERLRIADRLASVGTLSAGLGHDMNNVLFPIRCRLDAIDAAGVPEALQPLVGAMTDTVQYLQQLTDGLRQLAIDPEDDAGERPSDGVTHLEQWWKQVGPLLHKALPKRVAFEHELAPDLPPITIAPHQLSQAVLNLVVNAGEAMAGEGTVHLVARAGADPATVEIVVSDEGVGMSPETRMRAFDPFFTTKRGRHSTGLGLALVNHVVAASNGWVAIDSAPGEGTTVTLTIPVQPDAATGAARVATVQMDDAWSGAWMGQLLAAAGYEVVRSEGQPPHGSLWVTSARAERAATAHGFLAADPTRRVIAVGPVDPAWSDGHGVIIVDNADGLEGYRAAVREAASAAGETR